jgi:hypothetical protein
MRMAILSEKWTLEFSRIRLEQCARGDSRPDVSLLDEVAPNVDGGVLPCLTESSNEP